MLAIKRLLFCMLSISSYAHAMDSEHELNREAVDAMESPFTPAQALILTHQHVGSYLQRCQKEEEHLRIPCVSCGKMVPLMHEPCCNPYRGKYMRKN